MAGGQERILRQRVSSIQSTKKITRAMELVAASRLKKAEDKLRAAAPYADLISETVKDLAFSTGGTNSPFFRTQENKSNRVAHIVCASDRGLCGGYNFYIMKGTEGEIKEFKDVGSDYALITVGKKAKTYFEYRNYKIEEAYTGFSDQPTFEDAKTVADKAIELFLSGQVDRVQIIYTRFISMGSQEVVHRPLLPLDKDALKGGDGRANDADENTIAGDFTFEPDPETILDVLLPKYVEARVYADLLNSAASEQAARQRAMKAATENASDLILTYERKANQMRQEAITTEIMEVIGGAEALS